VSAAEAAYLERTPASQALWERARDVLPRGVSGAAKFFAPYPVFIREASGCRVVDADGNRYVDLLMGAGPMLLGHAHPRVVEAIREQAARMTNPMMPTELTHEYAERLRGHMPYLERIRFTNTGSEATRTAVRIARAVTGRTTIAKFEGGFHGSDDLFLVSTHSHDLRGTDDRPLPVLDYAGVSPRLLDEVVVLPYNAPDAAAALIDEHGAKLAAVIMEPVAFSSGGGIPATREFARAVRDATARAGAVFIFDEVVCALRMGLAGAPAYLGVTPDLSAVGKAIGGGLPLAAVGGRADLMEAALGLDSAERTIFQSGTFTENPLAIAAGTAVLDVLESEPVLERADAAADLIRAGLAAAFADHEVEAAVTGFRSVLQVHLGAASVSNRRELLRSDLDATRTFLLGMVAAGVLWPPVHPAVTSGAHGEADAAEVFAAARLVLERTQPS
jgi:glutamate-1-semialdehyde 2,1-aminomutase